MAETQQVQGYCLSCQARTPLTDPAPFVSKNGKKMMRGKCVTCEKVVPAFARKPKAAEPEVPEAAEVPAVAPPVAEPEAAVAGIELSAACGPVC